MEVSATQDDPEAAEPQVTVPVGAMGPPDTSETEAGYLAGVKAHNAARGKVPIHKFAAQDLESGEGEPRRGCRRCVPKNRRNRRVSSPHPWPHPCTRPTPRARARRATYSFPPLPHLPSRPAGAPAVPPHLPAAHARPALALAPTHL